jgi:DNA-binding MarR family transcriptional regulator
VSSVCAAAAVPTSTALRWIGILEGKRLLVRESDPADKRRVFIELSEPGYRALVKCLSTARSASEPSM